MLAAAILAESLTKRTIRRPHAVIEAHAPAVAPTEAEDSHARPGERLCRLPRRLRRHPYADLARTIWLRAADGSVNIVPFSLVTTITNMSRGIGNAAVSVTVAYNEDLDRVTARLGEIAAE